MKRRSRRVVLRDHAYWEDRWRETVWERADGDHWISLDGRPPRTLVVVSAWNPAGVRLPEMVNRARDGVLVAELHAMGLSPLRVRGRSPDRTWCEEAWQIVHVPERTQALLQRYGQIAGWITEPTGARHAWAHPAT